MKCKQCKKEIKDLLFIQEIDKEEKFEISTHGNMPQYSEKTTKPITQGYYCTTCRTKICKTEEEATDIITKPDQVSQVTAILTEALRRIEDVHK